MLPWGAWPLVFERMSLLHIAISWYYFDLLPTLFPCPKLYAQETTALCLGPRVDVCHSYPSEDASSMLGN
jgi:hypothetical protein